MKNKFSEYFSLTKTEIENLWKDSIIIFDTSFLLNIYRYSIETKNELLKVIHNLSDRLWITNQICFEFLENRFNVINEQIKIYDETTENLKNFITKINKTIKHPYVEKNILKSFIKISNKVISSLNIQKIELQNLLEKDNYLDDISKIYNNKVGDPFTDEKKISIIEIGKKRYENKIPPGYLDNKKDNNKKFGDLISWYQIIEKAKDTKKDILFVIDDLKEDWWYIFQGKKKGPRVELLKEIKKEANVKFYMYSGDKFLEFSNQYLSQKIPVDSIKEVKKYYNENLKNYAITLINPFLEQAKFAQEAIATYSKYAFTEQAQNMQNAMAAINYNPILEQTKLAQETMAAYSKYILAEQAQNMQNAMAAINYNPMLEQAKLAKETLSTFSKNSSIKLKNIQNDNIENNSEKTEEDENNENN